MKEAILLEALKTIRDSTEVEEAVRLIANTAIEEYNRAEDISIKIKDIEE